MSRILRLTVIFIISVSLVLVPFLIIGELPGERWLSKNDDNAMHFAITGSGLLVLDTVLPVPSSLVVSAMGARLGFPSGTLWGWLGLMLGNTLGYAIGHLFPRRYTTELPVAPSQAILFISRPVPVLAEMTTLTSGATRLPLPPFLIACALGNGMYAAIMCASAATLLPAGWTGPGLVIPMLVPALAWLTWQGLRRRYPP